MKKFISTYPLLFGLLIAFLAFGVFVATDSWFPWVLNDLGRHKSLVDAIYFTSFASGIWVYAFWVWRHRRGFWISIGTFLLVHILCVCLYSNYVQPILVWQWTILLVVESFVLAFFIYYSTQWLNEIHKRQPRRLGQR